MTLNEDDVVFCTVIKIEGTTVYLEIDGYEEKHASMVFSEVAAGRIRNLRQYVFPQKKVVCKVLKIHDGHVELSLRRVTGKERELVLGRYKRERALRNVLKACKCDSKKVLEAIKKEYDIFEFYDAVREDIGILEKFVGKSEAKKIFEIMSEKEEREKSVVRKVKVKSMSEDGVEDIKYVLEEGSVAVNYLGSSTFSVAVMGRDLKEADNKLGEILERMEKRAKEKKAMFSVVKEK